MSNHKTRSRSRRYDDGPSKQRRKPVAGNRNSSGAGGRSGGTFLERAKPFGESGGRRKKRSGGGSSRSGSGRSYGSSRKGGHRSGGGRRTSYKRGGRKKGGKQTIDIQTFIERASVTTPRKQHTIEHRFVDFGFGKHLQQNLAKCGFENPTPIQDQAIKPVMAGRDVIGLANTGTGKTGAFLLPLINKIDQNRNEKVLIIAPTRELAIQIDEEFRKFSAGMRIFSSVCIGGSPMHVQLRQLKRRPHVVIGTPGRLQDLAERKRIRFSDYTNVVLDEVDRMLDMGFIGIITDILGEAAKDKQLLFFSATLPPAIKKLVHTFLVDPVTIEVQTGQTTANVEQEVVKVRGDRQEKFDTLRGILDKPELEKVLIFSETKRDVERLATNLYRKGFKVDSIHGGKHQRQRQRSLTKFRDNKVNILVATDVAARGLDIKDVTHVINYTIPQTYDDYVHRIGRTGRGENTGTALTFV